MTDALTDQEVSLASMAIPKRFVYVRRQWNDYRIAKVPLVALGSVHWSYSSGGVGARSPRPFLHGYIYCTDVVEGELAHSCRHGIGPHSIKVCIVKKDNDPTIFAGLKEGADALLQQEVHT